MDIHNPKLWMPRPVRLNEPGWKRVDLEFTPKEWRDFEKNARKYHVPPAVFMRYLMHLALEMEK